MVRLNQFGHSYVYWPELAMRPVQLCRALPDYGDVIRITQ